MSTKKCKSCNKRLHYASVLFQIVGNKRDETLKLCLMSQNGQTSFKYFAANAAVFYVVSVLKTC